MPNFTVRIECMTFNHAPYIEDAMNGFCMQQTDFPFVCTIVDDACTDGEPEVIKDYLQKHFDLEDSTITQNEETDDYVLIYARHKTNYNCFFLVVLLKYNHYQIDKDKESYLKKWMCDAKYVSLCEGDDYWTDPNKLQMQIDFLESHPEYSMCFHNAIEHYENSSIKDKLFSKIEDKDYSDIEILSQWIVPTASVVLRKEVYNSRLYKIISADIKPLFGDTPLFIATAQVGKVRGLSNIMSVYRRQETGAVFNNVFDNPQKRDKILNDYYQIAKAVGTHLMEPIIRKHLQYFYEYKQPKYFVRAFWLSPLKTLKNVCRGFLFLIKNKLT